MTSPTDTTAQPTTADTEKLLATLGLSTGHCAIVGLQWGDEGKGKIVDLLTAGYHYVIRYNGGANAGHSLQVGEERYALHLMPSGILYPDKINVLGNGVVIDPEQLVKEITQLRERGLAVGDNLRISNRAHIVLPYHKVEDQLFDQAVAKAWNDSSAIGTTGRGIGPCYADKALRSTAVRAGDLLDLEKFAAKLERIVAVKNVMLESLARYCEQTFEPFNAEEIFDQTSEFAEVLSPHITDTATLLHGAMRSGQRLLFEGANATLLDIDHGTYPYVTSSNCSSLGVHTGTGVPGHDVEHVIGIAKAYQTRVGGGPMPTELDGPIAERIREVGREYGTTTGRPRRCGWIDLVALKYTAAISGATGIALMLLDVLAGHQEIKICTSYEIDGERVDHFPADADLLGKVKPVYETLPGFAENITECRSFNDLPEPAKRYIQRIEQIIDVPILLISVGPRRDQTIVRS